MPAVKRAVAGSSPTSNGTKTVAPKATKKVNCTPTTVRLNGDKFSCVHFLLNQINRIALAIDFTCKTTKNNLTAKGN